MSFDPYWNNVPFLVPLQTDPPVESRHGYTVNQGTTDVDFVTGTKPGAAWAGSYQFTGVTSAPDGVSGTMLRVGSTDDFTLGSGDFTIEAWCAFSGNYAPTDAYVGIEGPTEYTPHPIVERSNGTATGAWSLEWYVERDHKAAPTPDEILIYITFYCGDYAGSTAMLSYRFGDFSYTDWHHYAVTRNGNEWTLWMDGVPLHRVIATTTISSPSGAGAPIRIGNSVLDTSNLGTAQTHGRALDGWIADVRITKGYCRYGRSFEPCFVDNDSPPGQPLPTSEDPFEYSGPTYRGATGAVGAAAQGEPEPGEPGEGRASLRVSLPPPTGEYDQRNETETRRVIMDTMRRGN